MGKDNENTVGYRIKQRIVGKGCAVALPRFLRYSREPEREGQRDNENTGVSPSKARIDE
jgi:hypothetical protein